MSVKKYPGFIDVHVHLRDPGATHKEDFESGSRAAVRGGFTFVIDMPNNPTPTISHERLAEKVSLSQAKASCEIGFHYGTNGRNIETFAQAWERPEVFGLKLYCNHTTGEMLIEDIHLLEDVFRNWQSEKPVLVHAEGVQLAAAIALGYLYKRRLHVCHISQAIEVELVRRAKAQSQRITAGVCPHHLYLTNRDVETLKGHAIMKPPLGTQTDQDALWQGLQDRTIDIIETDHAPHTRAEKQGAKPAFGVPGLETAVGLMFKAVKDGRITEDDVVRLMYAKPKEIFNIPDQPETYVELDPDESFTIRAEECAGKCDWSPFDGWEVYGQPQKVVFKGKTLLENSQLTN